MEDQIHEHKIVKNVQKKKEKKRKGKRGKERVR